MIPTKETIRLKIESYLENLYGESEFDEAQTSFDNGLELDDDGSIIAIVWGRLSYYCVKDTGGSYGDGYNKVYEDCSRIEYELSNIVADVFDDTEDNVSETFSIEDINS